MMKNILKYIIISMLVIFITSCNTEYLDPNSILEPEVTSSTENLGKLINGMQKQWSTERAGNIYTTRHISGLNTGELRLLNPGNTAEAELINGGDEVTGDNGILNSIWRNSMLIRKEALTVIASADDAAGNQETANSLKAYALFYKAMVHGTLIQFFEQVPLEAVQDAPFSSRAEVLASAIADLETAKGYVNGGISSEVSSIVFGTLDLPNAIDAMLARFNLMAGNDSAALAAANNVDLNSKSVWSFDSSLPNVLAFWFGSQNVTQAADFTFGLPDNLLPEDADARKQFYVEEPEPLNYQAIGFWTDNLDDIPFYLPGEIMLIKAEANARLNNITEAIMNLDEVLTKTTDGFGVGANLPAYSGVLDKESVLEEIYRNRRIELYITGLGLEDSRRFGRPDAERNRYYYPYPNAERNNNTNTPANPDI